MPRKGGVLRRHSGDVLRCQNGSENFHNHTALDIRAGTGEDDSDSWNQAWDFQCFHLCSWPVLDQRCIPPVGTGERRLMNTSKDSGVFSQKNVKKGRKLIFFFLWQPLLNCRMFNSEVCLCYTHME